LATIQFNAYTITEVTPYSVVISLHMGVDRPFPTEKIEASKLSDVRIAFAAYVAKAKESGMPLQLSARVAKGRSPNGFAAAKLKENVNI